MNFAEGFVRKNIPLQYPVETYVRLSLVCIVITVLLVLGMERLNSSPNIGGEWPPEPDYGVIVTNNGTFYYVE